MSGCDDLKALLAPLGLYDLSAGTRNEAELFAWERRWTAWTPP